MEPVVGKLLAAEPGTSPGGTCPQTGHWAQKVQTWFKEQPLAALPIAVADF